MESVLVYPDGYVFDHFAEFVYLPPSRIGALFERDPSGYFDSVSIMCQILATTKEVAVSGLERKDRHLETLRKGLLDGGRAKPAAFFENINRGATGIMADALLQANWADICDRIQADTMLQDALVGLLSRDADVHWRDGWPAHYVPRDLTRRLPEAVKDRLYRSFREKTANPPPGLSDRDLVDLMEACVTTHYRTAFEYWGGGSDRMDYAPARTRAFMGDLKPTGHEVVRIVMPYVAHHLVSKTRHREALFDEALEWSSRRKGQELLEKVGDLRMTFDAMRDPSERKKLIDDIEGTLSSPNSRAFTVTMRWLRLGFGYLKPTQIPDAALDIAKRQGGSSAIGRLWALRQPALEQAFARELLRLVSS